jgi:hypothetical protein
MRPAAEPEAPSAGEGETSRARPAESHFELVIRVRHDEMAQWPPEKLAAFFEAVSVVMAAKSQAALPIRRSSVPGAEPPPEIADRIKRIEQTVDTVRRHVAALHESMAEDLMDFEAALASQNTAIQSTRTAVSQTDDLVERVVEALDALQASTQQQAAPVN